VDVVVSIISTVFAIISVAVVVFFTHKVIWLVRYKRVQRELMDVAATKLRSTQSNALPEWNQFAAAAWRAARGPQAVATYQLDSPGAYVRAVEHELSTAVNKLGQRARLGPLLRHALERHEATPIGQTVLEVPMPDGSTHSAAIELNPPLVAAAVAPPASVFELNVKSRYSFWRRALVFVTGLADVVYSAQHLAKMSQYTHVSMGTIFRRMSLVILLVVGIVLEVIVGLRAKLERFLDRSVLDDAAWVDNLPPTIGDNMASIIALVAWTTTVAGMYFTLYFIIKRRSKHNLQALQRLRDGQNGRLSEIRTQHLDGLLRWASEYGRGLDASVELTTRHIEMLGAHYAARLRRRVGGPMLLEMAKLMSDALFGQLPEATGQLQDRVTTKKRSLLHAVWPSGDEMGDVVDQAQYREAWQLIELSLGELRRREPDPEHVAAFWQQLVLYGITFQSALPPNTLQNLRTAYLQLVEETSAGTEADLERFQSSVSDLLQHLNRQLASATSLLTARIELANQRVSADSARYHAEIIRAREAARLEAMAFEI